MSLFSSRESKIHEHSSLAHARGMSGEAVVDLDKFYGDKKVEPQKNSEIVSSVIEIASRVSRMKMNLKKEGKVEKNSMVSRLLNEKPNSFMKAYDFKYKILVDTIYNGNAYVEIIRDGSNKVKELKLLNYDYVVVKEIYENEESTEIVDVNYEYITSIKDSKKRRLIENKDMLHFKPFSFGMTVGLSLIDCLERDLKLQEMSKDYLEEYLRKGGQMGGVLDIQSSGKLVNGDVKNLISREWEKSGNSGYSVKVTDGYAEYTPSTTSTRDFENILNSKSNVTSFSSLLGMPLHKLGISTSNMSLEELNNEFKNGTLAMYMEMFTTEINDKLFRNRGDFESSFEFDLHSNTIYDTKTMLDIISSGTNNGWMTTNEKRKLFGIERFEADFADRLESSLNFVDAETKNKYQLEGRNVQVPEGGGSVSGE